MKIKTSEHSTLGFCADCKSEHINPGCGLTWLQRMRSSRLDTQWFPNPPASKRRNFYDDDAVSATFGGLDRKERKEQYLEETKGKGALTGVAGKDYDAKRVDEVLGKEEL